MHRTGLLVVLLPTLLLKLVVVVVKVVMKADVVVIVVITVELVDDELEPTATQRTWLTDKSQLASSVGLYDFSWSTVMPN